jgi:hypothetical protein
MTPERRPETILGVYGEGYCRHCHFVEALDYDGLLIPHNRGVGNFVQPGCKGSGKRPPKLTPYASRLAAFSSSPPEGICPVCKTSQVITSNRVMARHWNGAVRVCEGTSRLPATPDPGPGRDHSNERGAA